MSGPQRYTVLQKVADGGMAEIYLGRQVGAEGFERPIVIKRIRRALSADPKFRNMLIDEAHIAMSLVHSNIVQVLDLGTAQGSDFLVLELVDGWDVNQLLVRSTAVGIPLPPELALHIAVEVCRALAFAHTRRRDGKLLGIVHRDISPHNILVSEQGEVKLTDFGIATAEVTMLERREQTDTGVVKGKLGFMSPEQASGGLLDHRTDLFSLGTTLYVLVTGKRPYRASTDLEILLRMQQCDFPAPEVAKPELAPELCAVLKKAMQKEPADRFQSAEEMVVALEGVQRSVFPPASQTELKRWLTRLTERDGVLPTTLRPPKVSSAPKPASAEIPQGSALVLEEVEPDAMLSSMPSVPWPVVPPPLPARAAPPEVSPQRMAWLPPAIAVGAILLTVGLLATRPKVAVSEAPDAHAPAVDAARPEPGPDAAAGLDASEMVFAPLAIAESDVDAGESAAKLDIISVRFVTAPPGATLLVSKQSFGTTPLSVRFKPELTYEIRFEKQGFAPLEKRLYIPRRKGQTVQVNLDKRRWSWPW